MAGYRDSSSFDPYGAASRPARPYNWAQWTGVALIVLSIAMDLAFLAGDAGWLPKWKSLLYLAYSPLIFGVLLVNSRRVPARDPAPELAPARRRWMIITVSVVTIILVTATIVDLATGR